MTIEQTNRFKTEVEFLVSRGKDLMYVVGKETKLAATMEASEKRLGRKDWMIKAAKKANQKLKKRVYEV